MPSTKKPALLVQSGLLACRSLRGTWTVEKGGRSEPKLLSVVINNLAGRRVENKPPGVIVMGSVKVEHIA
jgi:hypothetical protein